jgi:hypothetical protein
MFGPQFEQVRDTVRLFVEQLSEQLPALVPQPDPVLHVTVQHWLEPPAAQAVVDAVQVQASQPPPPSQYRVQLAG